MRTTIEAARAAAGKPRHAKKRRLREKFHKKWLEKNRTCLMGTMILGAIGPPSFKCMECGQIIGFYEAIARNAVVVEPLPDGFNAS